MVSAPIGVFDSGVGGLTVLKALEAALPGERFIYLGDTARLPYGTKTPETVVRYSLQAAGLLHERGIKALVVACNTASAAALNALREQYTDLPILGVIEPGAEAACDASRSGRIAVLATEGTVRCGAYQRAIVRLRADAEVVAIACPLFVALAEEGWTQGAVAEAAAARYLQPVFAASPAPDTIVLGCTHFPALRTVIENACVPGTRLVDSAVTTATALARLLSANGLAAGAVGIEEGDTPERSRFLATDGLQRFAEVGSRFLGRALAPAELELVDI